MKILLTGGTGFIGSALTQKLLEAGHELVVLTRQKKSSKIKGLTFFPFDYQKDVFSPPLFAGVDGVIHLAGEDLSSSRWTKTKKELIHSSRVLYTRKLVSFLNEQAPQSLRFFISASAIGYYPQSKNDKVFFEGHENGQDFLAGICREWEEEAQKIKVAQRVLITRFGIVLGKEGGALKKALPVFLAGTGGRLGQGTQWMSWIHLEDLTEAILFLLKSSEEGIFNLTAPYPVRNIEFTEYLAKALHRPSFMPVPETVLKLMAGEMATLLLSSQRVLPKRLEQLGFSFKYEDLLSAFKSILKS